MQAHYPAAASAFGTSLLSIRSLILWMTDTMGAPLPRLLTEEDQSDYATARIDQ